MKGFVYVLTNESMPGLVKIGRTTRSVSQRSDELFQTGVPTPFSVLIEVSSPDCLELEAQVHASLISNRVAKNREFFRLDPEEAVSEVKSHQADQVAWLCAEFAPDKALIPQEDASAIPEFCMAANAAGMSLSQLATVVRYLSDEALVVAAVLAADASPSFAASLETVVNDGDQE